MSRSGGRTEWTGLLTLDINPDHKPDIVRDVHDIPLPFPDHSLNEVHAYEVLDHVGRQGDDRFFLDQFADFWRMLKPGGHPCGSVPTVTSPWATRTRVISRESFTFLDQAAYTKQVGHTALSDFPLPLQG
jgi:hypothetical protein